MRTREIGVEPRRHEPGRGRGTGHATAAGQPPAPRCASSSSARPPTRCPPSRALHAAGHEIALVVTQPDRRRGRRGRAEPEPGEGGGRGARACRCARPSGRARSSTRSPPAAPSSASWSRSVSSSPSRCSTRCRSGSSTCTSRCCRAGAARRRSSGRCSPATPRPASASWRSRAGLDTGAGVRARGARRSTREETAGELRDAARRARAPTCSSRRSRGSRRPRPQPQVGEPTYADKLTVEEFALDWHAAARRARPRRPRREPAPGRVDHRRRQPAEGLAAPVWPTTAIVRSSPRGAARGQGRAMPPTRGWRGRQRPHRVTVRHVTGTSRLCRARRPRPHRGRRVRAACSCRRCSRESNLADRDRAFATDLVYGTVRAQRRLDDLLDARGRSARSTVSTSRARRAAPRRVPAAARRAAARRGGRDRRRARRRVRRVRAASPTRVLRALTRLGPPWPEPSTDAVALSYPDWIVERLPATSAPTTPAPRSSP